MKIIVTEKYKNRVRFVVAMLFFSVFLSLVGLISLVNLLEVEAGSIVATIVGVVGLIAVIFQLLCIVIANEGIEKAS